MTNDDAARAGQFSGKAISDRQMAELIGLARGLVADNELNDFEIEFLHKWLVASDSSHANPMIANLLERIRDIYADGFVDEDERADLTDVLIKLTANDFETGEILKSTTLPLCDPAPNLEFEGQRYCFTGTFTFGKRTECERAVQQYGATTGTLAQKTNVLVIGEYATASWKQSSFGNKIIQAAEWRSQGIPIAIVSEHHWRNYI